YLELAKPALADRDSDAAAITRHTLLESFEMLLRLLHPFMPFITEEIWQSIPHRGDSIMIAPYPMSQPALINDAIEIEIASVTSVVSEIRNIRGSQGVSPSHQLKIAVAAPTATLATALKKHQSLIAFVG